uniref:Uncharacterized protein n=1 Tax=Amphimedon queenslandica TaxID=400682 RepID=A0A1X7ULE4_AMPQE
KNILDYHIKIICVSNRVRKFIIKTMSLSFFDTLNYKIHLR